MWKPKSFHAAILPIYVTNLLFGCSLICYPRHRLRLGWSICYTIFHISLYSFFAYDVLIYALSATWFRPAEKLFFLILYVHFFMMIVNMIVIYFHRETFFKFLHMASDVEKGLKAMGGEINHQRLFIEILMTIGGWLLTVIMINVICMIRFNGQMNFYHNFMVVNTLQYPVHVNSFRDFNFSASARFIGMRLETINQLLKNVVKKEREICSRTRPIRKKGSCRITVLPKKIEYPLYEGDSLSTIQVLRQIHLELGTLGEYVTKNHGIQLTMSTMASFVMMIGFSYDIYMVWMNSAATDPTMRIYQICVLLVWIFTQTFRFIAMNYICDDNVAQYKQTSEIIHRLDICNNDDEFRNEIRQFSIQITQNQLHFQPCGLFTLGFAFTRSFIASVTTNLIILIQMSGVSRK